MLPCPNYGTIGANGITLETRGQLQLTYKHKYTIHRTGLETDNVCIEYHVLG